MSEEAKAAMRAKRAANKLSHTGPSPVVFPPPKQETVAEYHEAGKKQRKRKEKETDIGLIDLTAPSAPEVKTKRQKHAAVVVEVDNSQQESHRRIIDLLTGLNAVMQILAAKGGSVAYHAWQDEEGESSEGIIPQSTRQD